MIFGDHVRSADSVAPATVQKVTDAGQAMEDDGRRRRLVIIIVVALSVMVLWLAVRIVGGRLVNDEIDRIRSVASQARVDQSDLAFSSYAGGSDPLAGALAVDPLDVSLHIDDEAWCSTIEVRRLLSERSVSFLVTETGELRETSGC